MIKTLPLVFVAAQLSALATVPKIHISGSENYHHLFSLVNQRIAGFPAKITIKRSREGVF